MRRSTCRVRLQIATREAGGPLRRVGTTRGREPACGGHTRRAEGDGRGLIVARREISCCGCLLLTTDGGTHDSLGLSPSVSGLPL